MNNNNTILSKTFNITTHGRPIFLCLSGDWNPITGDGDCWIQIRLLIDGVEYAWQTIHEYWNSANKPFCITHTAIPSSGNHTVGFSIVWGGGQGQLAEANIAEAPNFCAFEI